MSRKPRQPPTIVLALLLPVLLVAGLWLGGHPEDLPGFLRSAFVSSSQTGVVDEALQRIAHDYYRPIPTSKLENTSIAGVVESLDDRFSHYLSPSEFREFAAPPHFTGIGVAVATQLSANHGLLIVRVFNSSPAARAGLKTGDVIVAVNGRKLERLSTEAATALIRGLPGTDVQLGIQGPPAGSSRSAAHSVKLTRAVVSEPVVESSTKTLDGIKLGSSRSPASVPAPTAKCAKPSNTSSTKALAGSYSTCAATAAGSSRRRS